MLFILHITHKKDWEMALKEGAYVGETLREEGFIHCSEPQQLCKVANKLFPKAPADLELLVIDPEKVHPKIKYEEAEDGELFPHIYGPLNTDAVIKAVDFKPDSNGKFSIPDDLL